jgi:hypothetical protein
MWLSGYYNSKHTVLDIQRFKEHADKLKDYCRQNLNMTVMEAAQKMLQLAK